MTIEIDVKKKQSAEGSQRAGTCPHLGLRDDAGTSFAFAAPANHCYCAQPPAAVQPGHQQKFCLTEWHVACPIFREEEDVVLPHPGPWLDEDSSRPASWGRRRMLAIVATVAAVMLVTVLFLLRPWTGAGPADGEGGDSGVPEQVEGSLDGFLPLTAGKEMTETETSTKVEAAPLRPEPSATPRPTTATPVPPTDTVQPGAHVGTASPTIEATALPAGETPTATPCGPPAGWVTYVVRPGETLFRIGLRVGLSVSELQSANCLNTTDIDAGQVIFVPYRVPQSTATSLPPTVAQPSATATLPPSTATSAPPSTATSPAPTATSIPPTATSPPPTVTPPPPPTITPPPPTVTLPPPPRSTPPNTS